MTCSGPPAGSPSKARELAWVYLATAPDQLVAEMWRDLLRGDGLPVVIRAGDTSSFLGVTGHPCRIMVQEDSLAEAREKLEGHLGRPVE